MMYCWLGQGFERRLITRSCLNQRLVERNIYVAFTYRGIIASISALVHDSLLAWTRLRWAKKLSNRGHNFSRDLQSVTKHRYLRPDWLDSISGCLLLVCLSRSFLVENPSMRVHPGNSHLYGLLCRNSCFLNRVKSSLNRSVARIRTLAHFGSWQPYGM